MTPNLDDIRVNAMATARAIKAVRLYIEIGATISHPPTEREVIALSDEQREDAVLASGVKVASEDTWKVTKAIARAFEHANAHRASEAVPVDGKGRKRAVIGIDPAKDPANTAITIKDDQGYRMLGHEGGK